MLMRNHKILFYSANPYEGGAVKFFVELVNNFNKSSHKTVVINAKNPVNSYNNIHQQISRIKIDTFYDLLAQRKYFKNKLYAAVQKINYRVMNIVLFVKNIRKFEIFLTDLDIDTLYSSSGGYPGDESCLQILIAAKKKKIKNRILILHNYVQQRSSIQKICYFFFDRLISASATKIVTVSSNAKKSYDAYSYFGEKVSVIHNGLNKQNSRSLEEKKSILGLKNEFVLGMIGNVEGRKGHIYLLKAFNLIKNKLSTVNIKLVIIGNVIEKNVYHELEQYIREHLLENHVIFKQGIISAGEFAECFDIMAFPSIAFESFGLVALEGMMYGVPVIGFNVGGIPEVITNGVTGYIVENKNYTALSERILKVIEDFELRKQLGENASKYCKDKFTLDIMIKKYEALLDNS